MKKIKLDLGGSIAGNKDVIWGNKDIEFGGQSHT